MSKKKKEARCVEPGKLTFNRLCTIFINDWSIFVSFVYVSSRLMNLKHEQNAVNILFFTLS